MVNLLVSYLNDFETITLLDLMIYSTFCKESLNQGSQHILTEEKGEKRTICS